jgi:hypothetical protein
LSEVLERVIREIAAAPHSAGSLTLYALVATLEFEKAGYMFKLLKLRDLSPDQRQLAFGLMELMASGANSGEVWEAAKQRMDDIVRAG